MGRYGALQNDALARVNGVASEAGHCVNTAELESCWMLEYCRITIYHLLDTTNMKLAY